MAKKIYGAVLLLVFSLFVYLDREGENEINKECDGKRINEPTLDCYYKTIVTGPNLN